ncbi:hypothetical protein [Streptomyces sp. NPDC005573]|uniref:hypothetical protein n=1 Tax=unclassified Streptomyces TaxID=2593676 RepID=UPI0033B50217
MHEVPRSRLGRLEDKLSRGVVGCAAVAAAGVLAWSDYVLVVFGRVVPGWVPAGVALLTAAVLLRGRLFPDPPARRPPGAGPFRLRPVAGLAGAVLILLIGLGVLIEALDDLGADYYVQGPYGPDGCRVVVRETSFLMSGRGDVYAAGFTGFGAHVGDWTADDGYRPWASGTYDLHWGPDGGSLLIEGDATDPVWSHVDTITC